MQLQNNIELQKRWVIIPIIFLYSLILFISAWLCDDAFITFRTVDNFINGYGLTWNISERVQAYTHPLWMFFLSAFYFFTREIYFTSITISIVISCLTVFLLLNKLSNSLFNSLLIGLILILSKSFIDYSTSGLENPLSHLLIVLFFIVYFTYKEGNKKLLTLSIVTSLAVLNRMDTILIFLPALFFTYLKGDRLKGILAVLTGLLPFFIWEIFSLFYYGFAFPNTAYAKLNTGIDQVEFIQQGLYYLLNSFYLDPLTLIVIIAGLFFCVVKKKWDLLPVSIGIFLYLIYIVKIGGDFMSGRFFSVPLLCSVIVISRVRFKSFGSILPKIAIILIVLILGLLSPKPTVFSTTNYSLGPRLINAFRFGPLISELQNDIADERYWFYKFTGVLNNLNKNSINLHPWSNEGIQTKNSKHSVVVKINVGFYGYFAGPRIHIIDPLALSDPLLSRIHPTGYWPSIKKGKLIKRKWRIGHFYRKIPKGYTETIATNTNKIENKNLAKYYDKLSLVIKGDLFDSERLKEVINLNLGKYDYLIEDYEKRLLNDREKISK